MPVAPRLRKRANLVCTASNQERLNTRIKSDGQYLLIVCLYGSRWSFLPRIPAAKRSPFNLDGMENKDVNSHFKHLIIAYADKHVLIRRMPINILSCQAASVSYTMAFCDAERTPTTAV